MDPRSRIENDIHEILSRTKGVKGDKTREYILSLSDEEVLIAQEYLAKLQEARESRRLKPLPRPKEA
jgi:hypothetical protein